MMSTHKEFTIKLSMSAIEDRPLSVSLSRFEDTDNPLIGVSSGFCTICGLNREDILGRNCRFLNQGLAMPDRERLQYCIRTGTPFMGVLENLRYLGDGEFETFLNLLHLVVVVAGTRRYVIGIQADVTGLGLDLADNSDDAVRLQKMLDGVFRGNVDAWVHFQEGMFRTAPFYLQIRQGPNENDDQIAMLEEDPTSKPLETPTQYMVLAPRFPQSMPEEMLKWRFLMFDTESQLPPAKPSPVGAHSAPPVLSLSSALSFDHASVAKQQSEPQQGEESPSSPAATMRNHLQALNLEDPGSVLSARGVSKLGKDVGEVLRAYCSSFGNVKTVHVPFVLKKRSRQQRVPGRCFIVMDSVEMAEKVLAQGAEQFVDDCPVIFERFCSLGVGTDE